ncbi:FGGY-family carbohydrate kinase [Anaerocolumna sp. AGMB13020]|uniref:xylulokinase n=1 Tax=Anaerocolumna sp. AGMB13020 TaxID=3081750 RepID=UPI0029532E22|nr:FGGY-family carbohydrate kinase [Anaerocolumna sp. AGMB13020]WOO37617.1 FGGY-family carbohydrate kinase [Anaerocolumna sp. AGMB13020]
MSSHVITYDVGTTGIKTCLYEISESIQLVASAVKGYKLYIMENGGAEQDLREIWEAMCGTTEAVTKNSGITPEDIKGISFCSQMQGLVLVDKDGQPIRPSMSYMDQRAEAELRKVMGRGPKISGVNILKLLRSIYITGAVAASVKDPVWKYNWVKTNEPENFSLIYKWLDVKEYLILQCTGRFVMTRDSAFGTMLYDSRKGRNTFSGSMCHMLGVDRKHLPQIVSSTDMVGVLTDKAAKELKLKEGIPVFGGGGDASLIGVGAGAVKAGSTHIYSGTSGWVSTVVNRRTLDIHSMIASVVGAAEGAFHYFAELETAGKCLEWVKDHMAMDEINIYLDKICVSETNESIYVNLYDFMMKEIQGVPAGSHGVIFTPWLHGNRCPFEDPNARGMFFNIRLETGKRDMIHAVIEGICYHLRWQLEAQSKKIKTSRTIRFVGGGALSPLTCHTLADVLGCDIETIESPQNAGALGAAVVTAVGLGILNGFEEAETLIKVREVYHPDIKNKSIHDRNFEVFKSLYMRNKRAFRRLNQRI